MSHPTIARLQLASSEHHRDGTTALHFSPSHPLRSTAGQHAWWAVPGGGVLPVAIASPPEDELVTLGTDLGAGGRFEQALAGLEVGATVHLAGPVGDFTLEGAGQDVVMLAQDLGVAPFRSMLWHLALTGAATRTALVHVGNRHPFAADTAAAATDAWYATSYEEFWLRARDVTRERREATFMVSGSTGFVRSTTALLRGELVEPWRIRRARPTGPAPSAIRVHPAAAMA